MIPASRGREAGVFERYSVLGRQGVMIARKEAGRAGSSSIDTEHLLLGLVCVDAALAPRCRAALNRDAIRSRSEQWHRPSAAIEDSRDLPINHALGNVFGKAVSIADERGCREIRTEHLLLAMMLEPTCHAAILLAENGADIETMKLVTAGVNCNEAQPASDLSFEALRAFLQ